MQDNLPVVLLMLISSVLAVAFFRVLRLPPMLAYFTVGLLLGPHVFGILPDIEENRDLAEFGIVFLMFSIGLEFSLSQLYSMRRVVLGIGGTQVIITMGVIMALCLLLGLNVPTSVVIGGALAMSSTAIVSKLLVERLDLNSRHGRLSFGVLLFQDIAVVPLLVLIPALAAPADDLVAILGMAAIKAALALAVLFVAGKTLMNRWLSLVARQRSRELFVMNVLMMTLVLAYITKLAGLSYTLGAFIAGMLISETRYRYQVESDIASFRDILLGLFFITIGMLLNVSQLVHNIGLVLLVLVGLIVFKAFIVAVLARMFGYEPGVAIRAGVTLAQAGEFSFVLLALGFANGIIDGQELQVVLAASLLSMIVAPFIIQRNLQIAEFFARSYTHNRTRQVEEIKQTGKKLSDHVIICGFGRSGQYLARFLKEENIPFIALDIDLARVQEAATAGENVVYGDASRRVVLHAAGIDRAKAMVISYNDMQSSMKILHVVQEIAPQLPVIVRTIDETTMEPLREAGASEVVPEVLEGSLMLASHALVLLGVPLNRVVKRIRQFREERYKMFRGFFHGVTDVEQEMMERDRARLHSVAIPPTAYAVGKQIWELGLDRLQVEAKTIRRQSFRPYDAEPESVVAEGDAIVLLGKPEDLVSAERLLLTGRT
ncbi:MAG TPA: cation:proton antiporter [Methylophilaceae bacterium]|nr:cation:proton antiporter [Methylophilaceae bacterium]